MMSNKNIQSQSTNTVTLPNDRAIPSPLERRSENDLAYDASVALLAVRGLPHNAITVQVQNTWIWLLGIVDREDQRDAASRAVENVQGIRGVTNLVRTKGNLG